jgi:hypothetical protein
VDEEILHFTGFSTTFERCAFMKDNSKTVSNEYIILEKWIFSDSFEKSLFPEEWKTLQCSFGMENSGF